MHFLIYASCRNDNGRFNQLKMENQKLPKMTMNVIKKVLSRTEMKNVMAGSDEGCLGRWWSCNFVTEETDCCGSGRCMSYQGRDQCV
jgi:hypothetical protein